jgi:peptide/nickel transport system permease protein
VIFGVRLGWFPTTALAPEGAGVLTRLHHLVLPALPLALGLFGYFARMVRAGTIEVLEASYVRTARLKGIAPRRVLTRHVLRNALPPTITMVALQAAFILSGAVIIERLFNYPGFGRLILDAGTSHDVSLLMAGALVVGAIVMGLNLVADVVVLVLDPLARDRSSR